MNDLRVILVGPADARARLRTRLPDSITVVGEAATKSERGLLLHQTGRADCPDFFSAMSRIDDDRVDARALDRARPALLSAQFLDIGSDAE